MQGKCEKVERINHFKNYDSNIQLLKLIKMKNSKLQNLLTKISGDVTTLKEGELSSIKGGTAPLNLVCNSGCLAKQ
ncbi:hypothetical protein CEQ15_12530 [Chryseobacterium indologenes]|nr:hypothetical protein CEQ15_12530 [Chryseobacterium indologenes]GAE64894.1 hypothetical protein CIN01S_09_03800 [Chryseobacterium indologenes NBRC 14944]